MQLSLVEVLILTLLIVASVSAFLFRFRKVVHAIRAAKPEKTWSLRPIAPRLARFMWEVLLQGKVILTGLFQESPMRLCFGDFARLRS